MQRCHGHTKGTTDKATYPGEVQLKPTNTSTCQRFPSSSWAVRTHTDNDTTRVVGYASKKASWQSQPQHTIELRDIAEHWALMKHSRLSPRARTFSAYHGQLGCHTNYVEEKSEQAICTHGIRLLYVPFHCGKQNTAVDALSSLW